MPLRVDSIDVADGSARFVGTGESAHINVQLSGWSLHFLETGNTGSVNVDPNAGSVQVPYDDVYGSYAAQAQQTLGQEYVPSGMKEYVQQYFTSLAPPGP